jgi:hypothetical protein
MKRTLEWIIYPLLGILVPMLMALAILVSWVSCLALDEVADVSARLVKRMNGGPTGPITNPSKIPGKI